MNKKLSILLCGILAAAVLLSGCQKSAGQPSNSGTAAPEEKRDIKIACTEVTQVALNEALPILEEQGYAVELVLFDNNVNSIKAVNDGSVDAALAVHRPFMETFNRENNGDLVMVEPYTFFTGIGLYSEKYDSLEDLPDGARISIMNDAMNMDKGLRMLRDAGMIELDSSVDGTYSLLDISENAKNLEIIDMDQSQTVRTLEDLDGAIVFFTHMRNADKDYSSYIIRDQDAREYPMGVVVKEGNVQAQYALDLAESLRADNVRQLVQDHFGGVFEYYEY